MVICSSSLHSFFNACSLCCPPQAIESFAVTVKDIAQMLQSFGTDLAETELTDEGGAIECLLKAHTDKYRNLKVLIYIYGSVFSSQGGAVTVSYEADVTCSAIPAASLGERASNHNIFHSPPQL